MSQTEPNFEELRRLLSCKQYEQPPPGYFISFSDKVLARIESEESSGYSSWWSWLVASFDAKPVFLCAYGLAVSGLLFAGFRLSQLFDSEMALNPSLGGAWLATTPASPILLSEELTQVSYSEASIPSVFSTAKPLREETTHLLFQGTGFHVQTAGLLLSPGN